MKRNNFRAKNNFRAQESSVSLVFLLVFVLFLFGCGTLFAADHGGGGGPQPLSWRTDLAIWTGVVFLGLLLILGKFAFGPIAKALDQREQSMLDQVTKAEKANQDAKDLLDQYQQKLADSHEEIRNMLEVAKSDADKVGQDIVNKSRQAAEEQRKRALADIDAATDGALEELATRSAELATNLAGKILKERIDPVRHTELINEATRQFVTK